MEEWKEKISLITGANSGIGLATVKLLLELKMKVVAIDKNLDKLEALKNVNNLEDGNNIRLYPLKVDLCQEDEVKKAFQWVDSNFGGIHLLVNNAGVGGIKTLLDGDCAEWKRILDVNVIAFTLCFAETITIMKRTNIANGQIINITSNLAHFVPSYAPFHFYSASKYAAKAVVEGFRQEILSLKLPIRITSISPGLVKTDILRSTLGEKTDQYFLDNFPSLNPEDVAGAIKYILSTPHHVTIKEIAIRPTGFEN